MEAPNITPQNTNKYEWVRPFVLFLASIILGISMIIWHKQVSEILVRIISVAIIALGIVQIVLYFKNKETEQPFTAGHMSVGMSVVAIGIFLVFQPNVLLDVLPFALACFIILVGFITLQTALEYIKEKVAKWYIPLIFALITIAAGFVGLINPFGSGKEDLLMLFFGIVLCVEGVLQIVSFFLFHIKKN